MDVTREGRNKSVWLCRKPNQLPYLGFFGQTTHRGMPGRVIAIISCVVDGYDKSARCLTMGLNGPAEYPFLAENDIVTPDHSNISSQVFT